MYKYIETVYVNTRLLSELPRKYPLLVERDILFGET